VEAENIVKSFRKMWNNSPYNKNGDNKNSTH